MNALMLVVAIVSQCPPGSAFCGSPSRSAMPSFWNSPSMSFGNSYPIYGNPVADYRVPSIVDYPVISSRVVTQSKNPDLLYQKSYRFTDSHGNSCVQPGFWYHKSVRDRLTKPTVIDPPKAKIKPESVPTARPDYEESKVPASRPTVGAIIQVSDPRPLVEQLPKFARDGVDQSKLFKPKPGQPQERYTTNSLKGERMIEQAKRLAQTREGDGRLKLELADDTNKPFVTIIGSTKAKQDEALKDFGQDGKLAALRSKIRLLAVTPSDWQVTTVGLPVEGDPAVVIQDPSGTEDEKKVILQGPYNADAVSRTIESHLRRPNPNFDPSKVPSTNMSWWDAIAIHNIWNSHIAPLTSQASNILVFLIGVVLMFFLLRLPPNQNINHV